MKIITIGRSLENDVVINDPTVTRHNHLQIIRDDNGNFTLIDSSTNGTFVNNRKVPEGTNIPLHSTDIIRIGNTTLPWKQYFAGDSAPKPSVSPVPPPYSSPVPKPEQTGTQTSGVFVLLLGIVSIGIIAYLVIDFYSHWEVRLTGVATATRYGFPFYLKYQIGWIIGSLAAAILAGIIADAAVDDKDVSVKTGESIAGFAGVTALIFLIIAIFAESIVKM
jgi:hypothetical protein